MWKGSGIVKRSSYLGASVICICMAGFAALRSYVTMPYLWPTSLAQLCVVTSVLDDIKTGYGQIKKVHIQNNLLW